MVMAVWTEADRRSSSCAPKYWLHTTAKPVPMPTEKPTARSTSGAVAWMPPRAAFPAYCPTTKVLTSEYASWKNDEKNTGTHSSKSCLQITPSVTSSDPELPRPATRFSPQRLPLRKVLQGYALFRWKSPGAFLHSSTSAALCPSLPCIRVGSRYRSWPAALLARRLPQPCALRRARTEPERSAAGRRTCGSASYSTDLSASSMSTLVRRRSSTK